MNLRFIFLALEAIIALSEAQSVVPPCGNILKKIPDPNQVKYVCGKKEDADKFYSTGDSAPICLFFKQMDTVKKVVFTPRVDMFESLQIKGLFTQFKDSKIGDLTVTAMSNGVKSRPAVFKKNEELAPILNLVVGLDKGKISKLDWRNNCLDGQGC